MTIISAIILGLVEGIAEFLPISSTGHMILASYLLGIAENPFTKSFEIIIQLGAILAVVFLYWKRLWNNRHLMFKVFVAFLPTAVIGLILYKYVKMFLGSPLVVILSLAIGGFVLVFFERVVEKMRAKNLVVLVKNPEDVTVRQALWIGVAQAASIIPGVSRSAATIVGGEFLGLSRKAIVEFSFLLAIPTMIAATTLDIYKNHSAFSLDQVGLLAIGFIVAFFVALGAVKTFLSYIEKNSFKAFGVYRVIVAVVFLYLIMR